MCLAITHANKLPLAILNDDCLNRSIHSNNPEPPEESLDDPNKKDTDSVTILPSYKPKDSSALSPAGYTRSGTPYLLGAPPKFGMYPFREVASGEMGTSRVHALSPWQTWWLRLNNN